MSIKVSNKKETFTVENYYMNQDRTFEGRPFEYKGLNFYLIKSKYWFVMEATTKKKLDSREFYNTKKECMEAFERFMNEHYNRIKEYLNDKTA